MTNSKPSGASTAFFVQIFVNVTPERTIHLPVFPPSPVSFSRSFLPRWSSLSMSMYIRISCVTNDAMWGFFPCSLHKLSGMVRRMVVRTVEHYQCGAVRVHYVNSREWSDVQVGRTSDYCHLWGSLRLAPITSIVDCVITNYDRNGITVQTCVITW